MSLAAKLRRAPLRAVTGAFVLNSGVGKLTADENTAKALHGMAVGTYGFLEKVDPKLFLKGLAVGEIAVGSVVLAPFVSPVVAGGAIAGFSGALLNMYWQTPELHRGDKDPRPTQQGVPIAKDVWMFGIGAGLVADGLLAPAHDKHVQLAATVSERRHGKQARKARKEARQARAETRAQLVGSARDVQADLSKRARRAAKKAGKSDTAKKLADLRDEVVPTVVAGAVAGATKAREAAADLASEYGPVVADKVTTSAKHARDAAADLASEYGPVVAEKAKQARDAAADLVADYGPLVADRAIAARDTAVGAATGIVDEYRPVVVKQSRRARKAAQKRVEKMQETAEKKAKQARKAAEKQAKSTRKSVREISKDTRKQLASVR